MALALAEELEEIGKAQNDAVSEWQGRFLQGVSLFELGELVAARAKLEPCVDLAAPARRKMRGLVSLDPYLSMLAYLAITLACLGYIDQARSIMNKTVSEARGLQHTATLAHTLMFMSWLDLLTGSPVAHVEEAISLATECNYPSYLAIAVGYRGRLLITLGLAQEALALFMQSLTIRRSSGHVAANSRLFAWLAEAHTLLGQPDEARDCLVEATRLLEASDERLHAVEVLHRVPGDLLRAGGDWPGAEGHYRQAIVIAERQDAKLFQLQVSIEFAQLLRDQGKRAEARDLLGPIYDWFTEGFDAPDLKDAKALLDELT